MRASAAAGVLGSLLLACGGAGSGPAETAAEPKGPAAEEPTEAEETDDLGGSSEPSVEDDGDEMQVEGLGGHLDPIDISHGVSAHERELNRCYHSKHRRKPFIGGKVEIGFTVGRDGAVKRVRMMQSTLGAWPIEQCLLGVAEKMQFPKPSGRGDATFSLPLDFTSGRGQVHWLGEEQAESEVGEYVETLAECSEEAEEKLPRAVLVTLYIGRRGKVRSVGFATTEKRRIDDAWAECARETVTSWQLTDPRGKTAKLTFRYGIR